MPIIAKLGEKRQFYLVPAGTVQAVCYDVWDLGMQKTTFTNEDGSPKIQHRVMIAWEINKAIPDGEYKGKRMVVTEEYTLSFDEKANLRKALEGWLGRPLTAEELKGYDLERLIGNNCLLSIIHKKNQKGDKTYARVQGIAKLLDVLEPMKAENGRGMPDWITKKRDQAVEPVSNGNGHAPVDDEPPADDEEPTPF